ncbi:TetR/AcrR family transcriptional regulator [Corynebacterium freiburgense]|uniref:TetR/AcrR family transcriptional regulator n=1 Tax=Corynebacterium freiburgense TaxID=556548 RepID=UPI0004103F19|nr:TetR/AcrR family transcriptional regulator [Corynebacterium freiburgense]WJZ01521.1 putative HTH-type transcriptional regulator YfiR [Corynebacterium freiburgense]
MSDRLQTQRRLVESARAVIIEHGIEGCTQQRICKDAGLTRGAFYSNYASKEELFTHVAQDAYQRIIRKLDQVVEHWTAPTPDPVNEAEAKVRVTKFLSQAQADLGLTREFFILHNELLSRAARVPEWAIQFKDINRDFVLRVSKVLELIVQHVGRTLSYRPEAIAQAVIGITLRATGVSAWKTELILEDGPFERRGTMLESEDVVHMVLSLLFACSEPTSK